MNTTYTVRQTRNTLHKITIAGEHSKEQCERVHDAIACGQDIQDMVSAIESDGFEVIESDAEGVEEDVLYEIANM